MKHDKKTAMPAFNDRHPMSFLANKKHPYQPKRPTRGVYVKLQF